MKVKIVLISLLLTCSITAQNGISYKALIKDSNGNVVANRTIDLQFSILSDEGGITTFYEELQTATTDQNGIAILEIGNGTATLGDFAIIPWERANMLNVQLDLEQDGTFIDIGNESIYAIPRAFYAIRAGTADNVSGLEQVNENGNLGWRLVGRDPNFYGDIGIDATDLSYSGTNDQPYGATGLYSLAAGSGTIASGSSSVATGQLTVASGDFSTALGRTSVASGNFSTAMGQTALATGGSSTAMGFITTASGSSSTAMGNRTTAEGRNATAMGTQTTATSYGSVAMGRYNVGGGDPNNWVGINTLLEVGNGSSNSDRNNALTIYKSGLHAINSSVSGLIIDSNSNGLIINPGSDGLIINSGDVGITIDGPSEEGIRITNPGDDGIFVSNAADYGGYFIGATSGVYARSQNHDNVDLILGGSFPSNSTDDDGIISTQENLSSSDMYLRSNDAVIVQLDYNADEAGNFVIRSGSNSTNVFNVNESGNVEMGNRLQIGTESIEDTGSNQLSFNASVIPDNDNSFRLGNSSNRWIGVWATDGTINTSDRREKKNIKELRYGLNEILQMQPVSFNWKNQNNPDTKLGLIAQDLQALIPEVVKSHVWEKDKATGQITQRELERLGVYYSDLVPVLIKAMQEQQAHIEELKSIVQQKNERLSQQEKINKQQFEVLQNLLSRVDELEQINNP